MSLYRSARLRVLFAAWVLSILSVTPLGPEGAKAESDAIETVTKGNGWIAFATDRDGDDEIYRMDFDGSDPVGLTNHPGSDTQPAWSPDGTLIAFVSDRTGNKDIFVMNSDGSDPAQLTNHPGSDTQPAWSPDGTLIAFVSDRTGNKDIFVMNSDGSDAVALTNHPASDTEPAWSPSRRRIAFTSHRTGNNEVFVMRSDGSRASNLTRSRTSESQPAWSPLGDTIAFVSTQTGDSDVFVMSADGSNQINLTNNPGSDTEPMFGPDLGYRMLFSSDRTGDREVFATWNTNIGQFQANMTNSPIYSDVSPDWQPLPPSLPPASPIEHVVVIFLENQSFDSMLGQVCIQDARCDGVSQGQLLDGTWIDLARGRPIVPPTKHSWFAQHDAMNGGLMNGFELIEGCEAAHGYACYQQYYPEQVPALAALARAFAISDMTFETDKAGSWGAHIDLVSPHLDGFYQAGHNKGDFDGPGTGCDSGNESPWAPTLFEYFGDHFPEPPDDLYPSCIPRPDGFGPYRESPVPWTPTIMDRLSEAGLSWHLYAPQEEGGYGWAICPTFANCIYTEQNNNHVPNEQFIPDATSGRLPAFSIVIPHHAVSQHNGAPILEGDNWIGSLVDAAMSGPDWSSTAIFITWDDCGCFYDHVTPPPGNGIRVPMVIVSPYAKPGYTDSNPASFASIQAFVEHIYGLAPMSTRDATAYDYMESFNFGQDPLPGIHLPQRRVPEWHSKWLERHPLEDEFT